MPNRHTRTVLSLALVLSVLAGHISDLTTGQPLVGVTVTAQGTGPHAGAGSAKTDRNGHYRITGLKPGTYTLSFESNDVPPQSATVKIGTKPQQIFNTELCSTTLDYHCAPSDSGGGG